MDKITFFQLPEKMLIKMHLSFLTEAAVVIVRTSVMNNVMKNQCVGFINQNPQSKSVIIINE